MSGRTEATAVPDGELSGEVVSGRYELGGLLGTGGMAEVYRAHDARLGRTVAIKLFRDGATAEDQIRLDREAKMLAGLQCPGVVMVFDTGSFEGRPFYVMQVIDGGTLRRRMRAALPPEAVAQVGAQVADTLSFVHARGVVHRDIKPSNILLCDDEHQAYLADFGLALQAYATRLTRSGVLVGTAGYLAPEQLRGVEVAPPTDVYALGLVLLECLTGREEYPGSDTETALARLSRPPRVPTGLPKPWAELLASMTHSDPRRRPTAGECAETLREAQVASAGVLPLEDIEIAFDDGPTVISEAPRRSRRVMVAFGGVATAAVVGVALGIANFVGADRPAVTTPATVETVTVVKIPRKPLVPPEKTKKPKKERKLGG